jgi:hypothetical protein
MSRFAALRGNSIRVSLSHLPFAFRHTFVFSILLHFLFFLLAAILVTLFNGSDDKPLPREIKFIFLPDESENVESQVSATAPQQVELSEDNQRKKSAPPAFDTLPLEQNHQDVATPDLHFSDGLSEMQNQEPLTSEQRGANLAESSPTPNYLPNDLALSPLLSTQFFSRERQHSLLNDLHRGEDLRLSPAQLAIPANKKERLLKKLRKLTDTFVPPTREDSTFVWEDKDQLYTVNVRHQKAETASSFDALEVEVSTERYGRTLSTKMNLQRLGFSQFAQFIDYWNPYVMVHDDKFDGRFHTNTAFKISGNRAVHPQFKGKVTTPGYNIHYSDRFGYVSSDSIFQGGLETGTPVIRFPRNLYSIAGSSSGDSTKIVFDEETWVTFHREGSFSWESKSGKKSKGRYRLPFAPFTIIGQSKKRLHVLGVVHGKVLVYNKGNITVDGNLTYARAPEVFDDADDFLGLVSEKDIEIAKPKKTGPGDLYIYAAMLAKGKFNVRNYYSPNHGTLFIYGSLTAGSLTATEPRYGTRIRFDKRLESKRPPHFPMTDRYELQNWDGKWEVENFE